MTSIREEKGLTYGIGAYLLGYAEGSIITIGAQADMDYIDRVIDETAKELRLLGTEPMAEEELHRPFPSRIFINPYFHLESTRVNTLHNGQLWLKHSPPNPSLNIRISISIPTCSEFLSWADIADKE